MKNCQLNQIIALVQGKKTRLQKFLTELHHSWTKQSDRLSGISRTYAPVDEDGEVFAPENRTVQVHAKDVIKIVEKHLGDFFNVVATQDYGNTNATADIMLGDVVLVPNVPVTVLLFLEKQLTDLRTFAISLPTLSNDRVWEQDSAKNCWVTQPEKTLKTQKKAEVIVKYEATKEHPAQTEMIQVDKTIGHWTTTHMSGALSEEYRNGVIEKIEKLQDAVKIAREKANSAEVTFQSQFANPILDYVFDIGSLKN